MEFLELKIKEINGGITAPLGYSASGIAAGIKKNTEKDIAMVFSDVICSSAGIFTLNKVRGHSLDLCEANLKNGKAQCIFINSGNANACLGPPGYDDALAIAGKCADVLDIKPENVLTASTGVIGHPLPMNKINSGIDLATAALSSKGAHDAATAIMTTDTYSKEIAVEFELDGIKTVIGGMAKGSGMIHPNMATMIGIITTDATVAPDTLKFLLTKTADSSFNRISVDGDTSVCDKVLIMSNGMSGGNEININTPQMDKFFKALLYVSQKLAKLIAADGEGATKLIEINISRAISAKDAHIAAKAVANSPLVKTAFYGEDANWGRILTAIGYSGADFNPETTSISIGPLELYCDGLAIPFNEDEAKVILQNKEIYINIDFGTGSFNDTVWTCDLSHGYIDINAHYRT